MRSDLMKSGVDRIPHRALFRALGGGWQPQPLPLPKATIDAMKKRTDWGGMLRDMESVPVAGQSEIPQAETHRGY